MRTIIFLASLTVLGFSGAAVAKDRDAASSTDVGYGTRAIQVEPRFGWNEVDPGMPIKTDRITTSSTNAGHGMRAFQVKPRFRWNEN